MEWFDNLTRTQYLIYGLSAIALSIALVAAYIAYYRASVRRELDEQEEEEDRFHTTKAVQS